MTAAAATTTVSKMFVNLPVKDLDRSVAFFKSLGFPINEQFSNEKGACVVLGEHSYAMLLTIPFFETFTTKKTADTKQTVGVLIALAVDSREVVDAMVNAAGAAGGTPQESSTDHRFMYEWGFEDLDGHMWGPFWMDPNYVQPQEG
jgi:uncharacterized protein